VKPASIFGWDVDSINHPKRYAIVCLVALLLTGLVAGNVRRGRSGRRLVSVRGNERAAVSLGINVYGAKLYAFALSAAIAGLGGVLLCFETTYVNFGQFDVFQSVSVVIYTVIGGVGFLVGGLFGGVSVQDGLVTRIVDSFVSSGNVVNYVALAFAVLLVPTLIAYPNGLASQFTGKQLKLFGRPLRLPFERQLPMPPLAPAEGVSNEATATARSTSREEPTPSVSRVTARRLIVDDVHVRFGGVRALDGVSLEVTSGEVVGLMGPNGAGKTTLIDAVTGFIRVESGTILLDDQRINGLGAQRRARLGIGRTFQSLELFDQLSVLENLKAASDPRDTLAYFVDLVRPQPSDLSEAALRAVDMFGLGPDLNRRPSELPYGRRRQVAIARAVAGNPSILLLDEPAAGLNEAETADLGALVRRLAESWGMGILLVEHDVPMLTTVCDRLVVIDFGLVIARGTPAEMRSDPRVVAAYLGEEAEVVAERVE
jgi:sulfate-transporting ATPase